MIPTRLQALVSWTHAPNASVPVESLLQKLTDEDLLFAIKHLPKTNAGRLAWAEYGNRAGFVEFKISTTVASGTLHVSFDAKNVPAHDGAMRS